MIKAVVFDCFGVLVGKAFRDIYAIAGGDPIKDTQFIEDTLRQANSGIISNEEFGQAISKRLGITMSTYRQIVDREEQPNLPLFDYIRTELKPKYKIAMLSNVNNGVIERKLTPELRSVFDAEIRSAEVGIQKPDPRIYLLTANKLGVKNSEMVFTDDHEKYLKPAEELGIHTVWYKGLEDFKVRLRGILNESPPT